MASPATSGDPLQRALASAELELALDRPDAAVTCIRRLGGALAELSDGALTLLVEAESRARRPRDASLALAELSRRPHCGEPLRHAQLARCRALLAAGNFEPLFREALAAHADAGDAFEEARTRLLYGERLRRAKRRADARTELLRALEALERLGATPWVERARRELAASARIQRRGADADAELTAQEAAVASLVAMGATNKEAAAKLFLARKTIEFHLGNVYRKLGVRSRTELAARLAVTARPETATTPPRGDVLIGREREVAEIHELIRDPGVRLVTLTGAGGAGKTRLAVAVADAASTELGETAFVELAPLRDPSLVVWAVARALAVTERAGEPLEESVKEELRNRKLLLVLDNFEHLLPAAPLLLELVADAADVKLLATSRSLLRVPGEHEYPIGPLAVPSARQSDPESLARVPSVALFLERAAGVDPAFVLTPHNAESVAALCAGLEGLPLAIELAAARLTLLGPEQMLARLEHRLLLLTRASRPAPGRHHTLRAAIDWSYALLDTASKQRFARLAIFVGSFAAEAAEAVAGATLDELDSLLESNLLRRERDPEGRPRLTMLETIREYAAERLGESGEAEELRRRHAEHFLALAEDAGPGVRGSPRALLDRLEREHDNFRAALDRLEASGETQLALRLAGALWQFWYLRGHLTEGRRRLEGALRVDGSPTAARAKALNGAAAMAVNGGDLARATLLAEEGLALHGELDDASGAAYSLFMLGNAAAGKDDVARAQRLYEESVRRFRELGDQHNILLTSRHLAFTYDRAGDRERARALHEDNLRRARVTRNERMEASTLGALAQYALDEGRAENALSMLVESLRIHRDLGDLLDTAVDLCRFAAALCRDGRAETAARLLSSVEALGEEIGGRRFGVAEMNEATLATIRSRLGEAAFAEAWGQGRTLTAQEAVALALDSVA